MVVAGDVLSVGERSTEWPAFVQVTTSEGRRGWVPERMLTPTGEGTDDGWTVREGCRYDTKELEVAAGTELRVLEADLGSGWVWCADPEGREGWVPVRGLEVV